MMKMLNLLLVMASIQSSFSFETLEEACRHAFYSTKEQRHCTWRATNTSVVKTCTKTFSSPAHRMECLSATTDPQVIVNCHANYPLVEQALKCLHAQINVP